MICFTVYPELTFCKCIKLTGLKHNLPVYFASNSAQTYGLLVYFFDTYLFLYWSGFFFIIAVSCSCFLFSFQSSSLKIENFIKLGFMFSGITTAITKGVGPGLMLSTDRGGGGMGNKIFSPFLKLCILGFIFSYNSSIFANLEGGE